MELSRDIVIEFAGMPKSGKTTVLDIIAHYLRRQSLPVSEFHGGGRYAPISKKDLPRLNVYLACEAIRYVLAADQLHREPRIHLMDRGIVDRMIFTVALNSIGQLSGEQCDKMIGLLALPEIVERIDNAFIFVTDAEKSLEREAKNKLSTHGGRIMNNDRLIALRTAVDLWKESDIRRPPTAIIDTALLDGDIQGTALAVLSKIDHILRTQGIEIELPTILGESKEHQ